MEPSSALAFVQSELNCKMYLDYWVMLHANSDHLADEESSPPSSPVFPTELRDKPAQATTQPKG